MATQIRPSIQLLLATCLMLGLWKLSGNVRSKFESLPIEKPSSADTKIQVNAKLYPVFIAAQNSPKAGQAIFNKNEEVFDESRFAARESKETKAATQQQTQSPEYIFAQSIAPRLKIDGFSGSGVFISGAFLNVNEELPISTGGQTKFKVLSIVNGRSTTIGFGPIRITLFADGKQTIDDPIAKQAEEAQRRLKEEESTQQTAITPVETVMNTSSLTSIK